MFGSTRRQFLLNISTAAAATALRVPLRAAAMESVAAEDGTVMGAKRLDEGWQFRRGPIYGIWEVWRPEENALWLGATLPHCFNEYDACDPDQSYFRGQGWYRTRLTLNNLLTWPYRTALQGAGRPHPVGPAPYLSERTRAL